MKKIDSNFTDAVNVLNKNKIFYWIGQGTLLGIQRENNLIEWDYDIDFCVWNDKVDKNQIINLMEKEGFKYLDMKFGMEMAHLSFVKKTGRRVDVNCYREGKNSKGEKIAYTKWGIPNGVVLRFLDAVAHSESYNSRFKTIIKSLIFFKPIAVFLRNFLIRKKLFYRRVGYQQPLYLLGNFKDINFHNLNITIPVQVEKYLEYMYGIDWKIPQKKFSWWKVKNLKKDYD